MSEDKIHTLDGNKFSDYGGFTVEFSANVFDNAQAWKGNLDQLNDMLRGGFGTPDSNESFTIKWIHSEKSKEDLGYKTMSNFLQDQKKHVHPTGIENWETRLKKAEAGEGETLFDLIQNLIKGHQNIDLILE